MRDELVKFDYSSVKTVDGIITGTMQREQLESSKQIAQMDYNDLVTFKQLLD
jgi:hypothetical protein